MVGTLRKRSSGGSAEAGRNGALRSAFDGQAGGSEQGRHVLAGGKAQVSGGIEGALGGDQEDEAIGLDAGAGEVLQMVGRDSEAGIERDGVAGFPGGGREADGARPDAVVGGAAHVELQGLRGEKNGESQRGKEYEAPEHADGSPNFRYYHL